MKNFFKIVFSLFLLFSINSFASNFENSDNDVGIVKTELVLSVSIDQVAPAAFDLNQYNYDFDIFTNYFITIKNIEMVNSDSLYKNHLYRQNTFKNTLDIYFASKSKPLIKRILLIDQTFKSYNFKPKIKFHI